MPPIRSLISNGSGSRCRCREKARSCSVSLAPRAGGAERAIEQLLAARIDDAAAQQIEIAEHGRQQIVEVVGDAAGELADRLDLLRLKQRRLRFLALGHLVL